jgi:hypothetical protein
MTSIADSSVSIQTSSESVPCPPPWFGEVVLMIAHLQKRGVLAKISERVQFKRRRFGRYEMIDFLAILFTPSVANARWRRFTSGSSLLPIRLWPCLNGISCLPVRRFHAF